MITFDVIDPKTGKYPELYDIARSEEWAHNLIYFDMDGFCLREVIFKICAVA